MSPKVLMMTDPYVFFMFFQFIDGGTSTTRFLKVFYWQIA